MFNSIIKGSIVGAIVAFVWGFVSWMVLPWHENSFQSFQNAEFVSWAIKENAPSKGIYLMPYMCDKKTTNEADREKAWDKYKMDRERGPVVFASVSPKGETRTMPVSLIINFVMYLIASGVVTALVVRSGYKSYRSKVLFFTAIGFLVAFLGLTPLWNWWTFPGCYIRVEFADTVITWLLIGLATAGVIRHKRPHTAD